MLKARRACCHLSSTQTRKQIYQFDRFSIGVTNPTYGDAINQLHYSDKVALQNAAYTRLAATVVGGTMTEGVVHKTTGVAKKVDPVEGKVILVHDPLKELKWPAMTKGFAIKDKALFNKLVVDKEIEFEFVQQGSTFIVTAVK